MAMHNSSQKLTINIVKTPSINVFIQQMLLVCWDSYLQNFNNGSISKCEKLILCHLHSVAGFRNHRLHQHLIQYQTTENQGDRNVVYPKSSCKITLTINNGTSICSENLHSSSYPLLMMLPREIGFWWILLNEPQKMEMWVYLLTIEHECDRSQYEATLHL